MEKRLFLAVILTILVVIVTQLIFPTVLSQKGSTVVASVPTLVGLQPHAESIPMGLRSEMSSTRPNADPSRELEIPKELEISVGQATYSFSSGGAELVAGSLLKYRTLDGSKAPVRIIDPQGALLSYQLIVGVDTIDLGRINMSSAVSNVDTATNVVFTSSSQEPPGEIELSYSVAKSGYRMLVTGRLGGNLSKASSILVDLPSAIHSGEADSVEDQRHLAYAFRSDRDGLRNIGFASLSPGEEQVIEGPLTWVVAKNKYFLVGLLALPEVSVFRRLDVAGVVRPTKIASRAKASLSIPVQNGGFAFEIYVGPQEWGQLLAMGRGFQNANPYGGLLRGVVQPFAAIGVQVLLWAKEKLRITYGWVLVLLAVVVRLSLWPLNQGAMRTSLKAQQLEPLISEIRERYKNDLEKQRTEIMRIYAEHGVNPLSQLVGCLPMLLPMPILFALFFVLQNTIEFRGVPFLWVPDISLRDPYYIAPIVSGVTMFLLSWVGMRGTSSTPNAKVMLYGLPAMMTVLFLNFASGLNIYYAVQNIAGLPQQYFVSRERRRLAVIRR